MSEINYVIREEGSESLIMAESDWDFLDTDEILENYPYIVEAMENEEYCLENDLCTFFDEIIFEEKVVGFATFEIRNEAIVLLTECFILPEFRGKRLFFDELCKMNFSSPAFGILQPTRNVVELLIDFAFAKNVTDDIVVSAFDFYFDDIDAKSTENRELFEDEMEPSNFYDLSINSTIFVDGYEVIYHDLLENDLNRYGPRKDLTDDYFNNLKTLFSKNSEEFDNLIIELKDELPQDKLTFDELIGYGTGLSDFMQGMVDNDILSYEKAMEIRQQLIDEYESGEIDDETIEEKFSFLVASEMSGSLQLDLFNDIVDDSDLQDDETHVLKEFLDLIGDNEELSSSLIHAIFSDDKESFENLLTDALDDDEKFAENFLNLAENINDDDYLQLPDDDFDFESLGLNLNSPYPVAEMMWGPNDEKYKLDDTYYGKDYPISHDNYMYKVLDFLKKHNNMEVALAVADMKGAATQQAVENLLYYQDFVTNEVNYDNWDEFAHDSLTVNDLKDILRQNKLRVSGKKQELIDRIAENQIPLDDFRSEKVRVTPKGDEFLQDSQWIKFYYDFLSEFDFNDYSKFLDENDGDFLELTLKYLEKHAELAEKEQNSKYMVDCRFAQELISKLDDNYFINPDNSE